MEHNGEVLDIPDRVIISPAAGVFHPVDVGTTVASGTTIGHVEVAGGDRVPVTSPFGGELAEVFAWPGERLQYLQRVAWLRAS
jgi:biotin carboxyl carrier protein